jgi:hypothetical protein
MIILQLRQCITTAPEEYDYRWARTLTLNVATDSRGRSLRLVENEDDWHFQQQMLRYGSGLHLTIDRQSVLADQVGYGLIKLTDNLVHIYRQSFDFATALDWPQDRLDQLLETVHAVRAIEGITFTTRNGGLAYSLEVRGDKDIFDQVVARLGEFERSAAAS